MDLNALHILDSLGWAIVHSLWLGAVAAMAVFAFRGFTRDSQAAMRCGFELFSLALCFGAFIGIFVTKLIGPVAPKSVILSLTDIGALPPGFPLGFSAAEGGSVVSENLITRNTPILGILWCLGFVLLATHYSIGFAMTRRLKTEGLSEAPQDWKRKFETLILNSGVVRHVSIYISNRVTGPITLGFFKPVVLVPVSFFSGLPTDQIEAILLHEIAHIRRHDYLINLIQTAIKTVLFFHPAVHYICRCIDEDREKACDDFAVNYTRNPEALARGLAKIRLNLASPNFAMAASRKRNPIIQRLARLTSPEETRRRPGQLVTTIIAVLAATVIYLASNVELANANAPAPGGNEPTPKFEKDFLNLAKEEKTPPNNPPVAPTPQRTEKPALQPISFEISQPEEQIKLPVYTARVKELSPEESLTREFESDMEKIDLSFDRALSRYEKATRVFAQNPDAKAEHERAKDTLARIVVEANSHRHARSRQYELEMNRLKVLRTTAPNNSLTLGYSRDVLANLRNDGLIAPEAERAEITYIEGDMFVDGKNVPQEKEGRYCSLNQSYHINKTENMRIEIGPENLTLNQY